MRIEDFNSWLNGVPVLDTGTTEFDSWLNGVPVAGNPPDDSNVAGVGRRRVWIEG